MRRFTATLALFVAGVSPAMLQISPANTEDNAMKSICFAAPAIENGVETLKETADEVLGPRRPELDAFHRRMGIAKEHWYVQETPQGPMVLVFLEGDNLGETFAKLATSADPFDTWFRDQAKRVHGIDFSQPMQGPLPEQILGVNHD